MINLAVPTKKFSPGVPQSGVNFFAPPTNVEASNSSGMTSADSGIAYAVPKSADTRPDSKTKSADQLAKEAKAKLDTSAIGAVSAGIQNMAVPATTDTLGNAASIAGNTLQGAASGAAAGAAIGGVGAVPGALIGGSIALVTSGLNAWIGNRQARAERDKANALNADAKKMKMQDRADLEKWRVINNLNTIEAAKENRRQFNENNNRLKMKDTADKMQNILTTSASAKAQWAKFGFV